MWRNIKKKLRDFGRKVAYYQTIIILSVIYFTVVALFSLIIKLMRKDLLDKGITDEPSFWREREVTRFDLEQVKHQF
jgi:hypothetical protein